MVNSFAGNVFIVAAPSGGGKTSLVKNLITNLPSIEVSISHTTRKPRPSEREGVDYFFVNDSQFVDMINNNEFIEHAEVFNHYYGTSVTQIEARLKQGIDVVLDIDWQGAQQIKKLFPSAVSVFVIPPSLAILEQRLQARQQDDTTVISERMQQAQEELSHYAEFDYLIVNDKFEQAAAELQAIVLANRLIFERQAEKIRKLLSLLMAAQ
ncbi:guanylate kinase [Legionella beliardensis]|uniref:Guanylate kinase n=1 Tax=Legionella beliardensis TaxID=91822 RepID=A0A378I4P7_9GAMM|nr:guanylate kinase [Legionella beliardensis]STX29651.1 guanylate kinase [Legionella beliardensis]